MGVRLPVPCLPDSCTGPTGQQLPLPKPGLYLPQAYEWARLLPAGTPQDLLWQQMRVMTRDTRMTPQSPAKGAQMKILQSKSKPLFSTVKSPANGIKKPSGTVPRPHPQHLSPVQVSLQDQGFPWQVASQIVCPLQLLT